MTADATYILLQRKARSSLSEMLYWSKYKKREIGTLTSTDGVRFTVADPLPVDSYYLWAGASGVRYAVDAATGTVKAKSYISYKRGEGTKGLYAFPEK